MASLIQYFRRIRSFFVVFGYQVSWVSSFAHWVRPTIYTKLWLLCR